VAPRRAPFARTDGGGFAVDIVPGLREGLRHLCDELRELLVTQHAAGDLAVARLFPDPYDDPLRNLDYERAAGNELLASKLAGIDTMQATLGADEITEDELLAWMRTINDLRLVMGIRLDVREESTVADFAGDASAAETFELYRLLAAVEGWILEALDPGLEEDPDWLDPPAPE
jgi:hypothetical protein